MMRKAAVIAVFAAGVAVIMFVLSHGEPAREAIRVSGTIEADTTRLAFRIPGVIVERTVREGDRVEAGGMVARLGDSDLREEARMKKAALDLLLAGSRPEEIAQAEAALSGAEARLKELLAGARAEEVARAEAVVEGAKAKLGSLTAGTRPQEIAAARAAYEAAAAEAARAEAEEKRMQALFEAGTLPERERDSARAVHAVASSRRTEASERLKLAMEGPRKEDIDQARAALDQAVQSLNLLKAGAREETVDQARAAAAQAAEALALAKAGPRKEAIEQARAAHALAETRLSWAVLRSPVAGVVLSEGAGSGEYAAPGAPVVVVADLSTVLLHAWIEEPDLGLVRPGMEARILTDSFPGKPFMGRITFVSSEAEFTPKSVQTRRERVKLVYRIKIAIPNPGGLLRPGMPADAEIPFEGAACARP